MVDQNYELPFGWWSYVYFDMCSQKFQVSCNHLESNEVYFGAVKSEANVTSSYQESCWKFVYFVKLYTLLLKSEDDFQKLGIMVEIH